MKWKKGSPNSRQVNGTHPIRAAKRKEKKKNSEDSLRNLWNNSKWTNICIMGTQKEKRERERGRRTCEEIIAGKFPNLEK